jgi:hypothetical protein
MGAVSARGQSKTVRPGQLRRYVKVCRTNLVDIVASLDHFDLRYMVSPALVSKQGGDIPTQFERTIKEGGVQF